MVETCMLSAMPCQHGVVNNVRRAEDGYSTPTSLVLTFCRNTVEVKDVRKGGEEKAQGEKKKYRFPLCKTPRGPRLTHDSTVRASA